MKNTLTILAIICCVFLAGCDRQGDSDLPFDESAVNDIFFNDPDASELDLPLEGVFVDDVVVNLGYECNSPGGQVFNGKTEADDPVRTGMFNCPENTTSITFYIGNGQELVLGTAPVEYLGAGTQSLLIPPDLTDRDPNNAVDFSFPMVTNIAVFLQSLDSDGKVFDPLDYNNVISIPEQAHELMTEKGPAYFSPDFFQKPVTQFIEELEASGFLEELHSQLVASGEDGLNQASAFENQDAVSVYVPPSIARSNLETSAKRLSAGIYSGSIVPDFEQEANIYMAAEYTLYVDRSHRLFGYGATSLVTGAAGENNPQPLVDQEPFYFDPASNFDVNGYLNEDFLARGIVRDNSGQIGDTTTEISFQGRIIDRTMFANQDQFSNTYPSSAYLVKNSELGRFAGKDVIRTGQDFRGYVTMHQTGVVSQNLDKTMLERMELPLHYQVTLYNFPLLASTEDSDPDKFSPDLEIEKKVNFTITEQGNIVSDIDSDCEVVTDDGETLRDASGTHEYVVGFIGSTRAAGTDIDEFQQPDRVSVLMLFSNPGLDHFGLEINANIGVDELELFDLGSYLEGNEATWRNRFNLASLDLDLDAFDTDEELTAFLEESQLNGYARGEPRTCSSI